MMPAEVSVSLHSKCSSAVATYFERLGLDL